MRAWNRCSCSASLTENQYLMRMIPDRTSIRSNSGHARRNSWYSSSVQKPMTRSTPARLYQLRSNRTISPAAGRWATYRWKYHWVFSRSVGAVSATTRHTRGFRLWVIVLMTPPFPAASRPSKTTTTRRPSCRIHSWSLTSSIWRRASSGRYALFLSRAATAETASPSLAASAADAGFALRFAGRAPDLVGRFVCLEAVSADAAVARPVAGLAVAAGFAVAAGLAAAALAGFVAGAFAFLAIGSSASQGGERRNPTRESSALAHSVHPQ